MSAEHLCLHELPHRTLAFLNLALYLRITPQRRVLVLDGSRFSFCGRAQFAGGVLIAADQFRDGANLMLDGSCSQLIIQV